MDLWGLKLNRLDKIPDFDAWTDSAKAFLISEVKKEVLAGIQSIDPIIHRTRLTGNRQTAKVLSQLGSLEEINLEPSEFESTIPHNLEYWQLLSRMPIYNHWHKLTYKDYKLDIFTGRRNPRQPNCLIEFSYPTPGFIEALHHSLPGLEISTVEYAVDFKCRTVKSARNLFNLFKHYIWVPRLRERRKLRVSSSFGHQYRRNLVMDVSETGGYGYILGPKTRMYGRGPDRLKIKVNNTWTWAKSDYTWVRVEFKINKKQLRGPIRENMEQAPIEHRHSWNAHMLDLFHYDCHFADLMKKKIKFMVFIGDQSWLPKEWDSYYNPLDPECKGCFQAQYYRSRFVAQKKFVKSRHTKKAEGFFQLLRQTKQQMHQFDHDWQDNNFVINDEYIS